jgi:hypothetical protein
MRKFAIVYILVLFLYIGTAWGEENKDYDWYLDPEYTIPYEGPKAISMPIVMYGKKKESHFNIQEFNQKQDPLSIEEIKIDPILIEKLKALRELIGKPIIITSGFRTPAYNQRVGGVSRSQHIEGKAVDIIVRNMTAKEIEPYAKQVGFTFMQTYTNKPHLHIDIRGE